MVLLIFMHYLPSALSLSTKHLDDTPHACPFGMGTECTKQNICCVRKSTFPSQF